MSMKETENIPCLKLIRFCGIEIFPIIEAIWYIHKEKDTNWFLLEVQTNSGITCDHEEEVKPFWKLIYNVKNLNEEDLRTSFKIEIPNGNESVSDWENVTNFYYFEHEPTHNNTIEILDRNDKKLFIRIECEVADVNWYDGSKPDNKIIVETWFDYGFVDKL